jgi:transposase
MSRHSKRKYTREFRAEAVRLVTAGEKPAAMVAKELGVPSATLYSWLEKATTDAGAGPPGKMKTDEREELARLRRENERLRQERDFLKKAAAFFAKDGN